MGFQIAIDGPAAAGKTTLAKTLAGILGFVYVDTGALYRAMGLYMIRAGVSTSDAEVVCRLCTEPDISIVYEGNAQKVMLDGEDVTERIRTPEISMAASDVGAFPEVRARLVELQQKIAEEADVVMEGRDICTCVLPDAQVKIYLTAMIGVRARRRHKELLLKGDKCTLDFVREDIINRDYQDMNRDVSPLRKAEDAVKINTTDMGPDDVVDAAMLVVRKAKREKRKKDGG